MRRLLSIIAAISCICLGQPALADAVPRVNCVSPFQRDLELAPIGPGPLRLTAVYCQPIRSTPFPKSDAVVSPDARSIAYMEHGEILRAARLDGSDSWTGYPTEMGVFANFDATARSLPAFAWSSHSRFLWSARQDKIRPSGFATSPLQPLKAVEGNGVELLPQLQHGNGPLDGLLWAGGDGLAVAQIGTRGGYYRPEHADEAPSFAIIDASRGLVKDTLTFSAIQALTGRRPFVRNAVATTLADGRVQTVLSVGQWVVWTEGQPPRALPDPYPEDHHNRWTMAPDGSRLLIARLLRTSGGMCGRTGGCRPGTPVEGVLAALHDVETGRLLWSIRATAENDFEFPAPAISPDGRYALVGLMPEAGKAPRIALVDMNDGTIVQTIPPPSGSHSMGFAQNGQVVWTHFGGLTALYAVQGR